MSTKTFTKTLVLQALKQGRLEAEFAWISQMSAKEFLNF